MLQDASHEIAAALEQDVMAPLGVVPPVPLQQARKQQQQHIFAVGSRPRRDLSFAFSVTVASRCAQSHVRADAAGASPAELAAQARLVRALREYYFHFARLIEREYRAASQAMAPCGSIS